MNPRIGSLTLDGPVLLAPMAGYTHLPFRRICRRFGAAMGFTELTNVDGIVRRAPPVLDLLATDAAERPVAAHLYGHRPQVFAEAAARVESLGCFDAIDINAGCPVRKIVARGAGAALIRDPRRLFEVVRAVRGAVSLPVTVKTRTGPSEGCVNIDETLAAVEEAGADALTIHARVTSRRHSGPADWERIAAVKARARIAVIGNGGIRTPEDAARRLAESGVDAVMIGRAALGNPWLFAQARAALGGQPWTVPDLAEKRAVLLEHLDGLIEQVRREHARRRRSRAHPEEAAARHFRPHLIHYTAGYPGSLDLRRGLNDIHSRADIVAALDALATRAADAG